MWVCHIKYKDRTKNKINIGGTLKDYCLSNMSNKINNENKNNVIIE